MAGLSVNMTWSKLIWSYLLVFVFGVMFVLGIQHQQSQYSPPSPDPPPKAVVEKVLDRCVAGNSVLGADSLKPREVSLHQLNIPDELVDAIAQTPSVIHLYLEHCILHEKQLPRMADSLDLQVIKLIGCNVVDSDVALLTQEPLRAALLDHTSVTVSGLIALAHIPSMRYISAVGLNLTREDLQQIAEINTDIYLESDTLLIVNGNVGTQAEINEIMGYKHGKAIESSR